jgi:hypothetical protein
MEQDVGYIPVSTRVDFRLQDVREVEEHPEFTELLNANKSLVKAQ